MLYHVEPDKEMADLLEEANRKKSDLEIYSSNKKIQAVLCQGGVFDKIRTEDIGKRHLRLIHQNRLGCYSYNTQIPTKHLFRNALSSCRHGIECGFQFPEPASYNTPRIYDERVENLTIDAMKHACQDFLEYINRLDKAVECDVNCETEVSRTELFNNNGLAAGYQKTGFCFAVWVRKKVNNRIIVIYDTDRSPGLETMECLADQVVTEINWGTCEVDFEKKQPYLPILFAPNIVNYFVNTVVAMMCAQSIDNGESVLWPKFGERIFDERLNIYDDGVSDWLMRSSPFDDEGIPTQITPIVEKGVFKHFICDLFYAARLKTKPTGNGRKIKGRTMTFHNTISLDGAHSFSFDEILRQISTGIYIGTALVNCNIRGDFMVVPKNCYKIEQGNITGIIKDKFRINGNIIHLFSNLLYISKEKKRTKYDMLLPYLACSGLRVVW